MAKVSQKKLDDFFSETKRELSAQRAQDSTQKTVRQSDLDDFFSAFRESLNETYTQEERDQMKAARAASLRPGETRRGSSREEDSAATEQVRTDGWSERYSRIRSNADYEENSRFRSTKTGEPTYNALLNSYTDSGYGDALYDYINGDADAGKILRNRMSTSDPLAVTTDLSFVEQMTDEERADYNYIYAKEGAKQAERYLDYIQSDLYSRQREAEEQRLTDYAEQHPVKATVESIAAAPLKGLTYAGQVAEAIANGGELDANASYNRFAYTPNTMRSAVSNRIEEKWGKAGSFGYNVAMSMADFLTASGISGGSGLSMAIMGSGAAADAALEALDRGVDGNRALALGAAAGAAEYLTEKFSVEQLFNSTWSESALKYVLKNVFTEASEESASTIINTLADVLISGDKSEWKQMVRAYEEQGFSESEAFRQTFWEHMKMLGLDALGGAISGGLLGAGGVVIGKTGQAAVNRENVRQGQETWREVRKENERSEASKTVAAIEANGFEETDVYEPAVVSHPSATAAGEEIEVGREVRRDQLMTLEEQWKADAIDKADDLGATALKYNASRRQISEARALSKLTGFSVEFFRQKNPDGTVKNGFYDPKSNKIYLNVNSKRSLATTFGHELTHTLEGSDAYEVLRDQVFGILQSQGKDIGAERTRVRDLYEKAGITLKGDNQVDADVVAEFVGKELLDNVYAIREVYRENPSVGRKIASAIDKMLIRATGMENTTAKAYLERASAMYHRADEIAENAGEAERLSEEKEKAQRMTETARKTGRSFATEEMAERTRDFERRAYVISNAREVDREEAAQRRATIHDERIQRTRNAHDAADRLLNEMLKRYQTGKITRNEFESFLDRYDAAQVQSFRYAEDSLRRAMAAEISDEQLNERLEWSALMRDPAYVRKERSLKKTSNRELMNQPKVKIPEPAEKLNRGKASIHTSSVESMNSATGITAEQASSESAGQRQTAPQTDETASGRAEPRLAEMDAQEGVRTSMDESEAADRMLDELNRRYEKGELSDEEYDEAYELIEEARLTGQGIESSATVVDHPEGKIQRGVRQFFGDRKKTEQDVQYSISAEESEPYDYSKPFAEQIDDYQNGKIPAHDSLFLGKTPDILQSVGFNALPVTINQRHVDYALNGTKDTDHLLGEENLKKLPEALADPVAVISSQTKKDQSIVAILSFETNGKQTIAAVSVDGYARQNNVVIDSNAVTSVFGKRNAITKLLFDAFEQERNGDTGIYYVNKEKADSLLLEAGLQLPGVQIPDDGFVHSIHDSGSPVNTRFGSVTQTQQFKRWFGDWENHPRNASKVVNADGTPKVVYHGTNANFNVFRDSKNGYWFSEKEDYAESMAEERGGDTVMEVYLDMKKPYYASLPENQFTDPVYEANILRAAKANGNDGVILVTETDSEYAADTFYVVFNREQIKSATDNIGTFDRTNPDIRFSISEDESSTSYSNLPVKAQTRVRELENAFGRAMDKMFGLGMTYKSPDFRQFLADNVRPLVDTYLATGSIPQEESDALFRSFYSPLSGADEALQKQEFYSAFDRLEEGLRNAARYAGTQRVTEDTETPENPMPTTEEAEELFRVQRDARREMDKVMYRLLLTPQDEVTVGELLRGTKSEEQITENRDDILEAYRVQKVFRDADAAVSVYRKRLKAELYRHVDTYLGNIADWKDKKMPLLYQRETMERNIRDIIPDKAEADAFIAEFISPVHRAEAQRQRFLGEYRDRVRGLNLSTKVQKGNAQSEAYAVQLLGEAQDNIRILSLSGRRDQTRDGHTLTEWQLLVDNFWDENPNMDRAKIKRAVGEFRQIYNELLPKINEVRIRNGYAPVAFRQGYFPHFTATSEDTLLAKLLHPFGIQFNADALPTSINGLTADFKPGITYFQFGNQRLGFETTYDALQGYEMYLNAASDVIYHTDNIQKLRALATRIRYLTGDEGVKQQIDKVRSNDSLDEAEKQVQLEEVYRKGRYRMSNFVIAADEYTNSLANKKSRFDRSVEELFGRPAYSVMKSLESRVAANMIAGNIGSALTNIIPLNQANAIIGNVNVLKGMYQTIRGMAKDDGFASMSDFLTNRRGSDSLVRTTGQKVSDTLSILMNGIDNFVSETIVRAAYAKNLKDGMGEELALQHADSLAASIMADRSKGALPLLFNARNPLMKLFTQFQVEVNNEYSVIFKDIPELAKADAKTRAGAAARIAGMLFKYLVGAWLFNDLYEKLFGRRAALDPVEMINNAVGGISGYQVPNVVDLAGEALSGDLTAEDFMTEQQDPGKVLLTLGTEAAESLPFIGGVLGGGRVPIQSALPDLSNLTMAATSDTWTGTKKALTAFEELSKPAAYLLPPFGGGQLQKMLRGGAAVVQGGVYGVEGDEDGGTYLKYPVYDDWQERLNAIVFGTAYTEGGREWVDSGFKSLSVKQTTAYQAMKEFGADDRAAYDLIQAYKSVPDGEGKSAAQRDVIRSADIPGEAKYAAYYNLAASDNRRALMNAITDTEPTLNLGEAAEVLMNISDIGAGKTAGACDLLAQSGLSEDTKKLIYRQEVSDQRDDAIAAAERAGITFDEYLDAHGAYSAIGNKDLSKSEQALEFSRYVENMNLSDAQKDTVRDIFKYYSQVPVQATTYNELRDLGISDDYAAKLVREMDALEPLPGAKTVSSIQKARVIVDTISDSDERLAALGTVLSESQYRKVSIAADAGLDPEVWVAFREILPEFDSDSNGSYTQAEMEDAIRAFSNGSNYGTTLMKAARNLSRDEMAILWQIGGNWKAANNPFDKATGAKIKELLDAD